MKFISPLLPGIRKFFAPFPRVPENFLKPLVPLFAWYVLLQGAVQLIEGFRAISRGFHYGSLPKMFTTLMDVNPAVFFIVGLLGIVAGGLYLMAFPALSDDNKRHQGWQQWVAASAVLTLARALETILTTASIFWFLLYTVIGWYFLFEIERVLTAKKALTKSAKKSSRRAKK